MFSLPFPQKEMLDYHCCIQRIIQYPAVPNCANLTVANTLQLRSICKNISSGETGEDNIFFIKFRMR